MQTIRYQTNIKNRKSAHSLRLQLQQLMADFVILFEQNQTDYILVLKGNREVSNIVMQVLNRQGIKHFLLTGSTQNKTI